MVDKPQVAVSEAAHRWAMRQAIANTVIEGHVPTPEFLADCTAVVTGRMTHEELRARSLARALAPDDKQAAELNPKVP